MMYGVRQLRPATAPVGPLASGSFGASCASSLPPPSRTLTPQPSTASFATTASADARGGLRFSKLTSARPVLASPHRRVQNPNRHRFDPSLAHFAPLQTYNTNASPVHRSHLSGVASLRGKRHQNRIGCILADGLRGSRIEPSLGAESPGDPAPRRPVFC